MHMADALITPIVGGAMWAASTGVGGYSIKKIKTELADKKIPLMGVMGAFVFASQMINFTIPGTGSSGHIGGGMLLAILLGPYAGFLTMASILIIQALFFADGGLLALGCNVFNMGFFTCFITYPFIFKKIIQKGFTKKRLFIASILSVVIGLQLGALSVVLETVLSGKTELPFNTFVLLMQPIHLAIGIVEGLITAAVVTFVWNVRPEILEDAETKRIISKRSIGRVLIGLVIATVFIGGLFSWFASSNPDGLEWAMLQTAGTAELETDSIIHQGAATIQEKLAFLPDYAFKNGESDAAIKAGTSISGIIGGFLTLTLAVGIGIISSKFRKKKAKLKG
ncbi:MAG: energy-coupling factor ABC transporter permease [Eubacteriales bacterium]